MEAQAAQEERHEQGKRRAKLEAGFAEVSPAMHCPVLLLDLSIVHVQAGQCPHADTHTEPTIKAYP